MMVDASSFDANYYSHCCGRPYERSREWLAFFDGIARRIRDEIAPTRVLDAGCAMGLLVEALRAEGMEGFGVDLSTHAIAQVPECARAYCRVGSIADDLGGSYDLVVCIEVLEHMPVREAEQAIERLCDATADILFSSSPLDYKEATHVNVHPPEYWAERFARRGFYRDVDFDASFITPWAVRLRRSTEPTPRVVRQYERRLWELEHERRDLRARVEELQQDVFRMMTEAEQARADVPALGRAVDEAHRELTEARTALAGALDTIAHMERSLFWKLRGVWVRFLERFR